MGKWNPDDPQDSFVSAKISTKRINIILFIFNFVFISLGCLALMKELNYAPVDPRWKTRGIWNGYTTSSCWKAKPLTHFFSLMKRFTVEPYAKIGFRFAFMFSGFLRVFISWMRSQKMQYDARKQGKASLLIFGLYKVLPIVMGVQVLFGGMMMTSTAHLDQKYMPGLTENATKAFFYVTALYTCLVILCDWTEASGFWNYSNNYRYLIRFATFLFFVSTFVPTITEYSTYLQKIVCHTNAASFFAAVTEYITILSLIIFHLTEHFDIPGVQIYVIEKKSY